MMMQARYWQQQDLYLNENLVNQDKATQLQTIYQARQILDDTIQIDPQYQSWPDATNA